jgi:hypothetical protein
MVAAKGIDRNSVQLASPPLIVFYEARIVCRQILVYTNPLHNARSNHLLAGRMQKRGIASGNLFFTIFASAFSAVIIFEFEKLLFLIRHFKN